MKHKLYGSIAEMLAPQTLSELLGSPVKYARCLPMAGGASGGRLMIVELDQKPSARLVLKHMSPDWDWGMRASDDRVCRSVTLWQYGLLDRLLPFMDHAIIACAYDESDNKGDWAILMRDMTETLVPSDRPMSVTEVQYFLEGLAAMHAMFWQAPGLADPKLGLCDVASLVRTFSPTTGQRLPSSSCLIPKILVEGWELLQEAVATDVADALRELVANPQPLHDALARQPYTLVHGDFRSDNLALQVRQKCVVALDWQYAGYAAATVDLAWYIGTSQVKLASLSTGEAIEHYQRNLARHLGSRFDMESWQQLLELGMLVNVLRSGCIKAWLAAQGINEYIEKVLLDEYNNYVRDALKWL